MNARIPLATTAALLAASALFVQYKSRQTERIHPPTGGFIEVDGVRLHYREQGSGSPVVLLHGNGIDLNDFQVSGIAQQIALAHRVILIDRPGFGYSDRPEGRSWWPRNQAALLLQALDRLQVQSPLLVAHSWGTLVALEMALARPDALRGLVLISGYYYPSLRLDVPLLSAPAIPLLGTLMRHTISPLLGRLMWPGVVRGMFKPVDPTPAFREVPAWMSLRPGQLRASAAETAMMVPAAYSLSKRYAGLTTPLTILAGEGDRVVKAGEQSGRLHQDVPGSSLHIAPAAGHMIHHQMPDWVCRMINRAEQQGAPGEELTATGPTGSTGNIVDHEGASPAA